MTADTRRLFLTGLGVLLFVVLALLFESAASGQGPYPYPTYLPPPAPIYRPTPTTTPGPVCCVVFAPMVQSANIIYAIPERGTP